MIIILSQEARPKTFKEVAGQELVKEALKSIIRNPDKAPKVLMLNGAFGSGKTTQARIFAKAINCPNQKGQEPCNQPDCPVCSQDLDSSTFYTEYDSSTIGNVEKIRELKDTFFYTVSNQYKVIVLDEVHLMSNQAQSALLKPFEEAPSNVFFILCTTHPQKVIPTIRSRSFDLRVSTVSTVDMIHNLRNVADKFGIDVEDSILEVIALKSKGHMRNAHMLLDTYSLLGKEKFIKSTRSAEDALILYLTSILKRDVNTLYKSLSLLQTFPVSDIKDDLNVLLFKMSKCLVTPSDSVIGNLTKSFNQNLFKLIKTYSSDWFANSFSNDIQMQTALLAVYQLMTSSTPKPTTSKVRGK